MDKTLTISSGLLLSLVLGAIVPIGSTVYWVSNLATRVQHTEEAVSNFQETDTSILQERISKVEEKSQYSSKAIDELYMELDELDSDLTEVEDELATWVESELSKIHEKIKNNNPLGQ